MFCISTISLCWVGENRGWTFIYPNLLPGIAKKVYFLKLGNLCVVPGFRWLQWNINTSKTHKQNWDGPCLTNIYFLQGLAPLCPSLLCNTASMLPWANDLCKKHPSSHESRLFPKCNSGCACFAALAYVSFHSRFWPIPILTTCLLDFSSSVVISHFKDHGMILMND